MIRKTAYGFLGGILVIWAGMSIVQNILPNPEALIAQVSFVPFGIIGIALGILLGDFLERKFGKPQRDESKNKKFVYGFLWGGVILLLIFMVGFYIQIQVGF